MSCDDVLTYCDVFTYCKDKNDINCKCLADNTRQQFDFECALAHGLVKASEDVFKYSAETAMNIIASLFTPQGLKMLGIFTGIDVTGKVFYNAVARCIARGLGKDVLERASQLAIEAGSGELITNAMLNTVITSAVKEGTIASIAFSGLKLIETFCSTFMAIQFFIQLIGAIFDAWDPFGYGEELDARSLEQFSNMFNDGFMRTFLSTASVGKDEFGRPIYFTQWPIEYYADNILNDELSSDDDEGKIFGYCLTYWNNLKINSNGEEIKYGDDKNLPSNDDFSRYARSFSLIISDNNTAVAKWLYKWLPIVIFLLGLLIVLLILLK